jgi:microcystin-dependent protein
MGIRGPEGKEGARGKEGVRGPAGPQGKAGPKGEKGEQGLRGETGEAGAGVDKLELVGSVLYAYINGEKTEAGRIDSTQGGVVWNAGIGGFPDANAIPGLEDLVNDLIAAGGGGGGGSVVSVFNRSGAVVAQVGDYTASQITNTPSGAITSNNVQGAVDGIDTRVTTNMNDIAAIDTRVTTNTSAIAALDFTAAGISYDNATSGLTAANAQAAVDELAARPVVPTGLISMWSGASAPSGWALCDGTNGTPDLRDRFIVGSGGAYTTGDTGGANSVTLTESEMPSHTHTNNSSSSMGGYGLIRRSTGPNTVQSVDNSPGEPDLVSSPIALVNYSTGGGQSHENRPPYYALAFIMKL